MNRQRTDWVQRSDVVVDELVLVVKISSAL